VHDDRDPSTSALLNALLHEWTGWRERDDERGRCIVVDLPVAGGHVEVPVLGERGAGRWPLGRPRRITAEGQGSLRASELAELLVGEPSIVGALGAGELGPQGRERFVARVLDSERNLEATLRERREELPAIFEGPLSFVAAEQALVLGHSVHPAPRAQWSAITEDLAPYVPAHGARVALEWFAVRRDRLRVRSTRARGAGAALVELDPGIEGAADAEHEVVPLHPLQVRALERQLATAERDGALRRLGPGPACWVPTSSMRTLHRPGASVMPKFSLPVRLTNSMRTLSVAELERGLTVARLLDQTEAGALEREFPGFHVLREPTYYGLLDEQGSAWPGTFVALRDDPFTSEQPAEVLATLLQDDPRDGCSRLATRLVAAAHAEGGCPVARADAWWSAFLARVVRPIVVAQADHGLLLSAHQQNLVLGLRGIDVGEVWFRDGQGTAYGPLALERYGEQVPGLAEACFEPPQDHRLFGYSFVVNAVFNVVASLAMVPGVSQAPLMERLRAELQQLLERPLRDPSFLAYLLHDPVLWSKGNLSCTLRGLDEVSLAEPATIYHAGPNPLCTADPQGTAKPQGTASSAPWAEVSTEPCVARLAGIDGDVELSLEGAEIDEAGVLRRRGRVQDEPVRVELHPGPWARVRWGDRPSARALDLMSDHLFGDVPGLRRVEHHPPGGPALDVVTRETFFQRPRPWHHGPVARLDPVERTRTGDIDHPRRLEMPAGLLYRRRCAGIDQVFSLRRFDPAVHLDAFVAWMNDPTVAEFWEQAWPRERLRAYVLDRLADPHTTPLIGDFDDVPFAYFESYWAKEDRLGPYYDAGDYDRGFHMAVGDARFRFRGYGRHWFLSMAHFSFLDEPRTQQLVGEPRVDQARVRSWGGTTPWRERQIIEFPHKRAVLMTLRREDFFAGFGGAP